MPLPKLSGAKQRLLDATETEISKLNEKLKPYESLINERKDLMRVRAQILSERGGARGTINPETVRNYFQSRNNKPASVGKIANKLGLDPNVLRSHLNRGKDKSYQRMATISGLP